MLWKTAILFSPTLHNCNACFILGDRSLHPCKGRPNRLRFRLIDGRFKKSENLQQARLSGRCTPARGNTERFNRGITCVQTRKQSR